MNRTQKRQAARAKPVQLSVVNRTTAKRLGYLHKRGIIDMGETRHVLARNLQGKRQ